MKTVVLSAVVAALVAAFTAWLMGKWQGPLTALPATVSIAGAVVPSQSQKSDGPGASMPMTQGEYLELKLNLECVARGSKCDVLIAGEHEKPYVFLSVHAEPSVSQTDAAMEALMECFRTCERFTWVDQVVLSQYLGKNSYRVARISFRRVGSTTSYERVFERIAWQQRSKSFLPGVPQGNLDGIPLSSPWVNK